MKNKYESLSSVLESKNRQIKTKDDFIQKALIAKINKRENQDEVEYLMKYEWAQECEDILYRRTKLGIHMTPRQVNVLKQWMK